MQADVAVLGAGFAGSLTALLLQRIGLRVVLIDRGSHPRFAIGESSTPSANLVLKSLCERYDLPQITPLAKYGTWKSTCPNLGCGPKRGFSYFLQRPHAPYQTSPEHDCDLLVAASSTLASADTHWLRSDVDHFLVQQVIDAGIPYLDQLNASIEPLAQRFRLTGKRLSEAISIEAEFLIDGTGEAGLVLQTLGIPQQLQDLRTNSWAVFAHFTHLQPWKEVLSRHGCPVTDHPFECDQSALHHLVEEGWMWQLRFDHGVTSAGFAIDGHQWAAAEAESAAQIWQRMLTRYPSLAAQFAEARMVAPHGGLCRSRRLQRRAAHAVGAGWCALPHTAGFIDPLHSTGIAQSLCGIERLVDIFERHWHRSSLLPELIAYERAVFSEIDLIDQIVACGYRTRRCLPLFAAAAMLYFAAATTFERRRRTSSSSPKDCFLCADDSAFRELVSAAYRRLESLPTTVSPAHIDEFLAWLQPALAPFNHVGLFAPAVPNMYQHTAVPES